MHYVTMHCVRKMLVYFNLAVSTLTAKLPNLIPCQIFRLYGIPRPRLFYHPAYKEKKRKTLDGRNNVLGIRLRAIDTPVVTPFVQVH